MNNDSQPLLLTESGQQTLRSIYRDGLLSDTLPFWLENANCVDREYGGFMFALDRDGSLLDTDKGMWQQGRFTWLLANLYNTVEPRAEWLEMARHGIDFMRRYGFDDDGRMFFRVTRDGSPLVKRRYLFTEIFGVMSLAAYAQAANDERAREEAFELFSLVEQYLSSPHLVPPKVYPQTRSGRALALPMILIVTCQILRDVADDPDIWTAKIDRYIQEIEQYFMKKEYQAVLESVALDGSIMAKHFDGRMLCPGHSIESAWFILQEAKYRNNDQRLIQLGTTILDWMWAWGWDEEYGGIIYFRDIKGYPVQEYWQDMKFWWPQNEAIIATLLAYQLTGEEKYARWHQKIHDWAYKFFPDPQYGEWFGYLHRDGRISVPLKGNLWKAPFHLPRMQLVCWQALEAMVFSYKQ